MKFIKIQYQKIENGLEILRIWQDSGIIKVPEQIEGIPVIRIAPYAFSLHKDEEEKNASVIRQRQVKRMIVLRSRKNSAVVEW